MPFDGKPEQFAKPDVSSLDGIIAWLKTQPGETEYEFFCRDGACLIDRYLNTLNPRPSYDEWVACAAAKLGMPGTPCDPNGTVAFQYFAMYSPRTYSAALARALALKENA